MEREKKFIDSFENGINQEALVIPLYSFFQKYNFVDGHLCISTNENNWFPSPKNWYYYSDFYFKKSGNQFYVYNSPNKKLEGQKYTGSYEDFNNSLDNIAEDRDWYYQKCLRIGLSVGSRENFDSLMKLK